MIRGTERLQTEVFVLPLRAILDDVRQELQHSSRTADREAMSAALQYEPHDPVAEARARYRGELSEIAAELASELGYAPGSLRSAEATDAARAADVSDLLVVARILA